MNRASRPIFSAFVMVLAAGILLGCPLLKKKPKDDDAGIDDELAAAAAVADAATVEGPELGAKNEKDVLRYANEEPLHDEPAVIGRDGVKVRNFPGNGPEVTTLNKGTAVVKVAKYFSTAVLIEFDDPGGEGQLIGWVPPSAFATDPSVVATTKPVVVPPRPTATSKPAATATATATATAARDAGAAPTAAKDAGSAPLAANDTKDAGGAAPQPQANPPDEWDPQSLKYKISVQPRDGKCPNGFAVILGMCRRLCTKEADCAAVRGTFCVTKPWSAGKKFCSTDK